MANFEAERQQADALFVAGKVLEALPLYEDLCQQDPTVAVFAERHGAGLLAQEATLSDSQARLQMHLRAIRELKRAQSLGDHSDYVRVVLDADTKTFPGAILAGIPLTVGYTYAGRPEAHPAYQQAEAAFSHGDWTNSASLYAQAASADPAWYAPALYAGDCYFRLKDLPNASVWFARAIAIDPDRETAYRYWGDALFHAGDQGAAREKFVQALVAEPYGRAAITELDQWARHTGHQVVIPVLTRPEFTTPDGVLKVDPALAASSPAAIQDGRASWILYQQYRVAHGARTLNQPILAGALDTNAVVTHVNGYQHTIAEEHAALRAMLADVEAKLNAGTLTEANLDPSIRNLRELERTGNLGAWIALNAADAGIRADYPQYRSHHRQHLIDYVNTILIRNQ